MPNQESPDVRIVAVRLQQRPFRQLEKLAKRRGCRDVTQCVRKLIVEAVAGVDLDERDYDEINRRVKARASRLARGRNQRKGV